MARHSARVPPPLAATLRYVSGIFRHVHAAAKNDSDPFSRRWREKPGGAAPWPPDAPVPQRALGHFRLPAPLGCAGNERKGNIVWLFVFWSLMAWTPAPWSSSARTDIEVVEQFYEPDQLGAALRDFDAVIIRSATKIKEPQIDAAKGGTPEAHHPRRRRHGQHRHPLRRGRRHRLSGTRPGPPPTPWRSWPWPCCSPAPGTSPSPATPCGRTSGRRRPTPRALSSPARPWASSATAASASMVGDKCQALGMKVLSVVHRTKPEGCECETMHFVSMDELLCPVRHRHPLRPRRRQGHRGRRGPCQDEGRRGHHQRLPGLQRGRGRPAGRR